MGPSNSQERTTTMTAIPLVRMLTDAGYGSRRDASQLVKKGLVEINGRIASSYTELVDPGVDRIVVTGREVAAQQARRIYVVMNKPEGFLCTTEDDRGRPTVMDLLPAHVRSAGLHPAGRLDEDSTGLLVLTNDGQLTYELTHPRFEHEKEYYVATTGRLTDADVEKLEQGVEIEGQKTWPARMKLLLGQSPYTYSITIHEGRKRQIRLMFAAIGQQVAMLKRVRMGGLLLDDLEEGTWRELTPPDLRKLMRGSAEERRTSRAVARVRSPYGQRPERREYGSSERSTRAQERPSRAFSPPAERRAEAPAARRDTSPKARHLEVEASAPRRWSGTGTSSDSRPSRFADERGPRPYAGSVRDTSPDRLYRRTASERDSRPYARRDSGPQGDSPYRPSEGDRDTRPYVRRDTGAPTDRPQRRAAPSGESRPYARRDSGPQGDSPYRRSEGVRDTRPYVRRDTGAPTNRPQRRAAPSGESRPYARRDAGADQRTHYQRADGDRTTRPYDRRESGAPTSRPYRRPETGHDSRPSALRDSGSDKRDSYRRPDDRREQGGYERPGSAGPSARPSRRPVQERSGSPDARQRRSRVTPEHPRERSPDDRRSRPRTAQPERRTHAERPKSGAPRARRTDVRRTSTDRHPPTQRQRDA